MGSSKPTKYGSRHYCCMVYVHMHGSAEWHVRDGGVLLHGLPTSADWHRLFIT